MDGDGDEGFVITERDGGGRRLRGQRGATLVEFALIFPIFMMVVLGMFSGGQAYNRKNSITNAAGEASRYGATLAPSSVVGGHDNWTAQVADALEKNAIGDLGPGVDGRRICVAYVYPGAPTSPHAETTHGLIRTTGDSPTSTQCFDDGRPATERRVQIEVSRNSPLDALFFRYNLTLTARSVTRLEATSF